MCLSIWSARRKRSDYDACIKRLTWYPYGVRAVQDVQITAWGFLALEVPNLNFRSLSLVSVEKVYRRDSEDCND